MAYRRPIKATPGLELSPRQLEILQMLANGMTPKQVARVLGLSINTLKDHVCRILDKLYAENITHAVAIALRKQLIQ